MMKASLCLLQIEGQLIRSPMNSVREIGRTAAGLILMRMDENAHVVGLQAIPENVVESSHRTARARALEKQAMAKMQEQEKALENASLGKSENNEELMEKESEND